MQTLSVPTLKASTGKSGSKLFNVGNSLTSDDGSTRAGSSARGASLQENLQNSDEEEIRIKLSASNRKQEQHNSTLTKRSLGSITQVSGDFFTPSEAKHSKAPIIEEPDKDLIAKYTDTDLSLVEFDAMDEYYSIENCYTESSDSNEHMMRSVYVHSASDMDALSTPAEASRQHENSAVLEVPAPTPEQLMAARKEINSAKCRIDKRLKHVGKTLADYDAMMGCTERFAERFKHASKGGRI